MSNPPRTIRRDTRVFISAVTRELGSVRKLVKDVVLDLDCLPVVQDHLPPDYRDVAEILRERIAGCDAVIHIAGSCYGYEPTRRSPGAPRRSYTQLEHDLAVELGKPVYVFLTGDHFPADPHDTEPPEFRELQQVHRRRLTSTDKIYNPVASPEQLDQEVRNLRLKVERLEGELQQVDQNVALTGRRLRRWLALVAVVGIASLGAVTYVGWRQRVEHRSQEEVRERQQAEFRKAEAARKVVTGVDANLKGVHANLEEVRRQFADPDILTGKIKSHIRRRADEEIAAAKAKAPDDWRRRDEITKRRDQALERVENLVETIRKGLAGEPDPIFVEAAEILGKQGVDEAIKYLEQKQPSIEKKIGAAESSRDQAEQHVREEYRPLILLADFYEVRLKWDNALEIRERVARKNPLWFEARNRLGLLLLKIARFGEAEPHLRAAVELTVNPDDQTPGFNDLASLLRQTNRASEAEPLYRRALAVAERSYGPDHPTVASGLNNLALLLGSTNRLSEAEPLMARAASVHLRFQRATGHEHPNLRVDLENYRRILTSRKLADSEIVARIKAASEGMGQLSPIVPEVERLLGPAKSVVEVLSSLDRQYKEQGKPGVYFLGPKEPIAPRLDELLRPNGDGLTARGVAAFRGGAHADAVVLYEAALELMAGPPAPVPLKLRTRMNRAAALRELGLFDQARDELSRLLAELEKLADSESLMKGRAHYHLALCQWRLGDRAEAQTSAEKSLATYDGAPKSEPISPAIRRQSEELLAALKEGQAPPPLAAIDAPAALEAARARYRAREALAKLGLKQPAAPLLDQILGPARPTEEVFDTLDRQYREQGKPPVWFLPLNEPIAPHLDELLGKPPE